MIIVSQEKDTIINFENIEILRIGAPLEDNDGKFKILTNTTSDSQYMIGEYDTEERATKILEEIANAFVCGRKAEEGKSIWGFSFIESNTYYEMPKE